jgi:hypothetical protein
VAAPAAHEVRGGPDVEPATRQMDDGIHGHARERRALGLGSAGPRAVGMLGCAGAAQFGGPAVDRNTTLFTRQRNPRITAIVGAGPATEAASATLDDGGPALECHAAVLTGTGDLGLGVYGAAPASPRAVGGAPWWVLADLRDVTPKRRAALGARKRHRGLACASLTRHRSISFGATPAAVPSGTRAFGVPNYSQNWRNHARIVGVPRAD